MKRTRTFKKRLILPVLLAQGVAAVQAADISWTDGTASYNTPANWSGGVIPGFSDRAINDKGLGSVVQINLGDPDWLVGQLIGGNTASGAFLQNGQKLTVTNFPRSFILGANHGSSGAYTLNGGTINYTNGFAVGQLGQATFNMSGGTIAGSGNFAVNFGSALTAVNATMDDGLALGGHTWFERGFYPPDATRGMPAPGSTVVSETQGDHSWTLAPTYTTNNTLLLGGGLNTATATLTTPKAAAALSFLGSSGNGAATINYTIRFSGGAPSESGSFVLPDWYPPAEATIALRVGGRVQADGFNFQNIDNAIDNPKLVSVDVNLVNTTSPIVGIDLSYVSGGRGGIMGIASSPSSGAAFTPLAITGYNADTILGVAENNIYVASNITNTLNQTGGTIDTTGEFYVGNYGAGIYNFSNATNYFRNWFALGRSGGNGRMTMTSGLIDKSGNGNFMIGTGYQSIPGGPVPTGYFDHSGGTIYSSGEFMIPENSPAVGTYNISGTAQLFVTNWMQVGRSGGSGLMNMTGGSVTKVGGGNFIVGDNATGVLNHSAGTISVNNETWVGQGGSGNGTYNLSGTAVINANSWFAIGREGGNATFNMSGGTINKTGGGVLIIGDNSVCAATMTGGTITANELWVANGGSSLATYDVSGNSSITVSGYTVIGRDGQGTLNMNGGSLTKTGDGGSHLIIASGGVGTLNQTAGSIVATNNETWIAENGSAAWNMSGGTTTLAALRIARWAPGSGSLYLTGGTLTANEILGGDGTATVNFNGGKVVAGGSNPNFLHDLDTATVGADTTFDTAGYDIAFNQILDGGAAIIKTGAGTLSLNATNSHYGAINITAGKVAASTLLAGLNNYSVAAGAGLGVKVATDNGQLLANSVAFAGAGSTLSVDLTSFGSPGAAPLSVAGDISLNGNVAVNISSSGPLQVGTYPLIVSGSRSGSGSFVLGTLPLNTVATIVDSGTLVSLNVTSVNAPRWEGLAGGNWDVGVTTNWVNGGTGLPITFSQGSTALFNDQALGVTSVNVVGTILPSSVTVNNDTLPYTLTGAGKISGTTGLSKQGSGSLTIANVNDYTGPTVIAGGVVTVTNLANGGTASAIGASSANPTNLVISSGTLSYAGAPVTTDRGFTYASTNSTLDIQTAIAFKGPIVSGANNSGIIKTGPGPLAYIGTVSNTLSSGKNPGLLVKEGKWIFDGGTTGQTNRVTSEFWVGTANVPAHLALTNTTLLVDSWLAIGIHNGNVSNVSTLFVENSKVNVGGLSSGYSTNADNLAGQILTLNNSTVTNSGGLNIGEVSGSTGVLTLNGNSVLTNRGDVNFGPNTGSAGHLVLKDTSVFGSNNRITVAGANNTTGSISVANSAKLYGNAWFNIGQNTGGTGDLTIKDNGLVYIAGDFNITDVGTGTATMTLQDNGVASGGAVYIGKAAGTTATVNQSGGTFISRGGDFRVGSDGNATYNQTGGSMIVTNWGVIGRNSGSVGVYNLSGGTATKVSSGSRFIVGENGTGTLNVSGTGSLVIPISYLDIGRGAGSGTVNLNGGSIEAQRVVRNGGTSVGVFNFNGGKLIASATADPDFLGGLTEANVQAGGAVIDTRANNISIRQALLDGTGGGGLTKIGTGKLNLNGANTYTGTTLVNEGALGGSGVIAGPVTVMPAGTMAPGAEVGTLTVNNNVNLGGKTVMEIAKTNGVPYGDLLAVNGNLTIGGTLTVTLTGASALAVGDTFNLIDATSQTGTFTTVSLPAGYGWDTTQLYVNGTIRVSAVQPPATSATFSNGNLVLTGTGGTPGGAYSWVTTTNAATPLPDWTTSTTGVFDSNGAYSNAFPVNVNEPSRFFRLKIQ